MVNINLTSGNEPKKEGVAFKKGLFSVIFIFLVILAAYGGFVIYKNKLAKDTVATNDQYSHEYAILASGNAKEVADFQNRLVIAKDLVNKKNIAEDSLVALEKVISPGVYLEKADYDNQSKQIILACVGDNYDSVAKQILNFKNSDYFNLVKAGETSLAEGGKVKFPITLSIK